MFGKLRPYLAKVAFVDFHGACTTELLVLQPLRAIDGRFISYLLLSDGFIKLVDSFTYGAKMPRVSGAQVGNVHIPIPSFSEQRTIAAFLDRETAEIDALMAKKERLIELLQEKRAALISRAVAKGLDPDVLMKASGVEWLGEVPAHWNIRRLKYLTPEITVGIVVTPAKYYVDEGIPCLRSLNVQENGLRDADLVYISRESNENLRKSMIFKGDLVSVRTGQPGTTAVVTEQFDRTNCIDLIITRQSPHFDSSFMAYVANSYASKAQFGAGSDGAIQQHFNIQTAKNLLVALPPYPEQQAITIYLDRETAQIDALVAKVQTHVEKLREYRLALISAAVSGKIDVREAGG